MGGDFFVIVKLYLWKQLDDDDILIIYHITMQED